jgi:hypothetical protein
MGLGFKHESQKYQTGPAKPEALFREVSHDPVWKSSHPKVRQSGNHQHKSG